MRLQHRHGVIADPPDFDAGLLRHLIGEVADQRGDVLAPVRQRRDHHWHDGKPVEQILAEPAFRNQAFQILRGR
jgi:hypothetical protein